MKYTDIITTALYGSAFIFAAIAPIAYRLTEKFINK